MILIEKRMNLFEVDEKYYLAHCISADYALGAGIAVEFERRFDLKPQLNLIGSHLYPDCIQIGKVLNLVTKERYYNKPTYETLYQSLKRLKYFVTSDDIKFLAMPKIGCGLDRLSWVKVKEQLELIFKDIDIEILICSL